MARNRFKAALAAVVFAVGGIGQVAIAQTLVPSAAIYDDWSVFETNEGGRKCWIASAPQPGSTARRNGQNVTVRRGDIMMMVSFRPDQGVSSEVSYTGGYPYREDGKVTMQIKGTSFDLFTEGEWAWPATPQADAQIIAAMKAAAEAKVTGVSGRGTTTVDTISAIGFTAALNDASKRCS